MIAVEVGTSSPAWFTVGPCAADRRAAGWCAAVSCAVLLVWCAASAAAAERPNIILLVTDDQRWDTLGVYGNEQIVTPHLDQLAREGTLFRHAFCTTSICSISRATILAGTYPSRHGVHDFQKMLSPDDWKASFPRRLKDAGYHLGFIGKWGVGGANVMPKDDYDYWAGFPGQGRYYPKGQEETAEHLTSIQGRQMLEFLAGCPADRPFCLHVSYKAAHCQDGEIPQFPPDRKHLGLYDDTFLPHPPTATPEHFARLPEFLQTSEARVRWQVRFANPEMHQATVKDYYRLITGIDETVGQLRAELARRGLDRNTVIVFTSDHGFYLGDHGLAGKWFMHDPSIRVPLIVYDPRIAPTERARSVDAFALLLDIAPTIVDVAGLEIPERMQGRSLAPLARGETVADWRRDFYYEHPFRHARIAMSEGVRGPRWKYVRYTSVEPLYEELFDLANDPHEERNLAGDPAHAATLAEQRARWQELAAAAK